MYVAFLTQMLTILVVLASLMLLKAVFLTVIGYSWDYTNFFFQVFCVLPDLGLCVILATFGSIDLFETSQYRSGTYDSDDDLPLDSDQSSKR